MSKLLKFNFFAFTIIGLLTITGLVANQAKQENELEVPKVVRATFQKSFPDAKVSGYDAEVVEGKTHFEIETMVGEMEKTYVYLENATLLQIEEKIETKALPEIVVAAINKAHPVYRIDEADKITRGPVVEFEVVIEIGDKELELLISTDGKILGSAELDDIDEENDEEADDDEKEGDDEEDDDDGGEDDD